MPNLGTTHCSSIFVVLLLPLLLCFQVTPRKWFEKQMQLLASRACFAPLQQHLPVVEEAPAKMLVLVVEKRGEQNW
jgi:hypothetical protein